MGRGGKHGFGWSGDGIRPAPPSRVPTLTTFVKGVSYTRKVVGTNYAIRQDEYFIGIGDITGSIKLVLPKARLLPDGYPIVIKDERGHAGTYPVTIETREGDTIDGTSSVLLESPYAAINIYTNGTNRYFIY